MQYKLSKDGTRTEAYRFTVKSKNDVNLIALKNHIKQHNNHTRYHCRARNKISDFNKLYKVRIMARGPRKSNEYLTYNDCIKLNVDPKYYVGRRAPLIDKNGNVQWNQYQSLRHEFGTSFDVYVSEDTLALSLLDDEIKYGITTHRRKQIQKLNTEINKIKQQAYKDAKNMEVFRLNFAY